MFCISKVNIFEQTLLFFLSVNFNVSRIEYIFPITRYIRFFILK